MTDSLLRMACSAVTLKTHTHTHTHANSSHPGTETVVVTTPAELRDCNSSWGLQQWVTKSVPTGNY